MTLVKAIQEAVGKDDTIARFGVMSLRNLQRLGERRTTTVVATEFFCSH